MEIEQCYSAVERNAVDFVKNAGRSLVMRKRMQGIGIALVALSLVPGAALAELPRSAAIATHAVGSLYNAIGTGIATVVSRHTPMTVRVQPFAGPPAWLPSMNEGDTDKIGRASCRERV